MKALKRALHDTFDGRFFRSAFLLIGGACFSFGAIFLMLGGKEAMLEMPYIFAGLAGTIGPILMLFLYNLVCAPYRIERDRHIETKRERDALLAKLPAEGRKLSKQEQQILSSEILRSRITPKVINVVHFPSEECTDFADSIGDAISRTSIPYSVHDGGFYTKDPKDRGVKLYHSENDRLRELAELIKNCFERFGHPCELRHTEGKDNMFFYIARSEG